MSDILTKRKKECHCVYNMTLMFQYYHIARYKHTEKDILERSKIPSDPKEISAIMLNVLGLTNYLKYWLDSEAILPDFAFALPFIKNVACQQLFWRDVEQHHERHDRDQGLFNEHDCEDIHPFLCMLFYRIFKENFSMPQYLKAQLVFGSDDGKNPPPSHVGFFDRWNSNDIDIDNCEIKNGLDRISSMREKNLTFLSGVDAVPDFKAGELFTEQYIKKLGIPIWSASWFINVDNEWKDKLKDAAAATLLHKGILVELILKQCDRYQEEFQSCTLNDRMLLKPHTLTRQPDTTAAHSIVVVGPNVSLSEEAHQSLTIETYGRASPGVEMTSTQSERVTATENMVASEVIKGTGSCVSRIKTFHLTNDRPSEEGGAFRSTVNSIHGGDNGDSTTNLDSPVQFDAKNSCKQSHNLERRVRPLSVIKHTDQLPQIASPQRPSTPQTPPLPGPTRRSGSRAAAKLATTELKNFAMSQKRIRLPVKKAQPKCPICTGDKIFTDVQTLKDHLIAEHGTKGCAIASVLYGSEIPEYVCELCWDSKKSYATLIGLQTHLGKKPCIGESRPVGHDTINTNRVLMALKGKGRGNNYDCPLCLDRSFVAYKGLQIHLGRCHGEEGRKKLRCLDGEL